MKTKKSFLFLAIITVVASGLVNCFAQSCISPPANIIAWWPADGNTDDIIGGNNGILVNGATFTSGKVDGAFSFNGTSSYVKIPQCDSLNIVNNHLTIEFWMYANTNNALDSYQGLVASDFFGVEISNGFQSTVGVNFYVSSNGGGSWGMISEANGGGAVVSAGAWHHIAGTYNGTNVQLYVDGQPWGNPYSYSGNISPMSTDGFIAIGSEDGRAAFPDCIGARYFDGAIDEVSIYSRALSASEILSIYNAGTAGKCISTNCSAPPSGLIDWWPAQCNADDIIGINDGILMNGATFADGEVGEAFSFNGTNSYVKVPYSSSLNLSNKITIEFWMDANTNNSLNSYQGLVASDFYGVEISNGTGGALGVNFYVTSNNGGSWGEISSANGGGIAVSSGVWHHIAGTYDGSHVQLYIDGQAVGSPFAYSGNISPMPTNGFVAFGSEDGRTAFPSCVGTRYFHGLIDEISIYNRALSASEIQAIHNAGAAGKCVP